MQGVRVKSVDPKINLFNSQQVISKKGEYFVLSGDGKIILFNKNGNELWTKVGYENDDIDISPSGNYIIALGDCINIFNKKGEIILKQDISSGYFYDSIISFSPDEKYCIIGTLKDKLYFFQLDSPMLLWEYSSGDLNIGFTSASISANGNFIFVGAVRHIKGVGLDAQNPYHLFLLNKSKEILWKKEIKELGYQNDRWGSKVFLSSDGTDIYFTLPKGIVHLKNEFLVK
ncbi:MAG: WD40 repeat domain-containing protein [bacterium]